MLGVNGRTPIYQPEGKHMRTRTKETSALIKKVVSSAGKRGKTIGQLSDATGEGYPKLRRIIMRRNPRQQLLLLFRNIRLLLPAMCISRLR